MPKKVQSSRLTVQQKEYGGVVGIFGGEAKLLDLTVGQVSQFVAQRLAEEFPQLSFRYRKSVKKEEIYEALRKVDPYLGQTLFVANSSVIPDGGLVEVMDDCGNWRVALVSEAKYQGKDIENIAQGKLVGIKRNQDVMSAGNAIERAHKKYLGDCQSDVGRVSFSLCVVFGGL